MYTLTKRAFQKSLPYALTFTGSEIRDANTTSHGYILKPTNRHFQNKKNIGNLGL